MAIETRRIGTTDIEVTTIGLGGAFLGQASEAEATPIVDAAWAGGVRYFDTAPLYGMGSSEIQRNVIATRGLGLPRG